MSSASTASLPERPEVRVRGLSSRSGESRSKRPPIGVITSDSKAATEILN